MNSIEMIAPILVAIIASTGLGVRELIRAGTTSNLSKLTDLYLAIPNDFESKQKMKEYLDEQISEYVSRKAKHRRDLVGIITGILLLLTSGLIFLTAAQFRGWWLILSLPAIAIFIIGLAGLIISIPKKERDEKGNPIEKSENKQGEDKV